MNYNLSALHRMQLNSSLILGVCIHHALVIMLSESTQKAKGRHTLATGCERSLLLTFLKLCRHLFWNWLTEVAQRNIILPRSFFYFQI